MAVRREENVRLILIAYQRVRSAVAGNGARLLILEFEHPEVGLDLCTQEDEP